MATWTRISQFPPRILESHCTLAVQEGPSVPTCQSRDGIHLPHPGSGCRADRACRLGESRADPADLQESVGFDRRPRQRPPRAHDARGEGRADGGHRARPGRGLDSLLGGGDTAQYGARGKRLSFGAITGAPRGTPRQRAKRSTALQKYFVEETRLGIPIIVTDEALHGVVGQGFTNYPSAARVLQHVRRRSRASKPSRKSASRRRSRARISSSRPCSISRRTRAGGASKRHTARIPI